MRQKPNYANKQKTLYGQNTTIGWSLYNIKGHIYRRVVKTFNFYFSNEKKYMEFTF